GSTRSDLHLFVHRLVSRVGAAAPPSRADAFMVSRHGILSRSDGPASHIDRRTLLQRARRSPLRPRRSRAERSVTTVAPVKAVAREVFDALRMVMGALLHKGRTRDKPH